MTNGSSISTPLYRADDLDPLPVAQRRNRPLATRYDGAVDRDGATALVRALTRGEIRDRRPGREFAG
jgi:hypothetical protein